jgi:hypothetical protein
MAHPARELIEPAARIAEGPAYHASFVEEAPVEQEIELSKAISLKRIADMMERVECWTGEGAQTAIRAITGK